MMRRKFDRCPLGEKCWTTKTDDEGEYISTCHWYVEVRGKNPQSEEQISDWKCALAWLPLIGIENSQTNRGQTQAIERLTNESVKGQKQLGQLLASMGQITIEAIESAAGNAPKMLKGVVEEQSRVEMTS